MKGVIFQCGPYFSGEATLAEVRHGMGLIRRAEGDDIVIHLRRMVRRPTDLLLPMVRTFRLLLAMARSQTSRCRLAGRGG